MNHKDNLKKYYQQLPLTGLITSIVLFILFYFILDINSNFFSLILYCLLPFIIYTLTSIIFTILLKNK